MKKIKILTWMVVALLILNTILLVLWFSNPRPRGKREEPKFYIIKTLAFDASQEKDYEKLIEWHQAQMQISRQQIMFLKNKLYAGLRNDNFSEVSKDSIVNALSDLQIKIEKINYQHFQDIKKICKPEQLSKFNDLTLELSKLFSPSAPKHAKN